MRIVFIDTSIFCNMVPVPGRDQHREEVLEEYQARLARGDKMILPITAVIESGNFIAQIADGAVRRTTAGKFSAVLSLIAKGRAPWVLNSVTWDGQFISDLVDGGGSGASLIDHAVARVGTGDLCILCERVQYVRRSKLDAVEIWTKDAGLAAHS